VWWWSVLFSPLVVLWSGGLKDLHSDYLQWILQTQNNPFEQLTGRILYWPQYLLAWSWDVGLTARLNVLVRVGSFVFCVVWCGRLVALAAGVCWWRVCVGLGVFCVVWSWWWPELGDSLVYSGTSLGVFVFLVALGDPAGLSRRLSRRGFWLVLGVASFVSASTYVHSLLVVLPLFAWVVVFGGGAGRSLGVWLRDRILVLVGVAVGSGVAVLRLSLLADEETGLSTFGLLTRLRTTRHLWDGNLYLWDSLRVSVALLVVSVVLAWWSRSASLVVLSGVGFVVSMGVVPIAALKHVQANLMMPRYFAAQITFGLLLQFLVVVAMVLMVVDRRWPVTRVSGRGAGVVTVAKAAVVAATVVAVCLVAVTPLGFGLNYRDQSYNSKAGVQLSAVEIQDLRRISNTDQLPLLVFVGYWDLYPHVFQLRESAIPALALEGVPIFDYQQANFTNILESGNYNVLCAEPLLKCQSSIHSVLDARQLPRGKAAAFHYDLKFNSEISSRILRVRS